MPPQSADVAKTYNQWGREFDRLVAEAPFLINCYRLYARRLEAITAGRRFPRALDVGCGSGTQSFFLASRADEVVGIDIASEWIEAARERCKNLSNIRFQVEDARKLPFPDASFDLVVSYGAVLSHIVEGYEDAVREIARVTRPGGSVTLEADTKWNLGMLYHPLEVIDALRTRGVGHSSRFWEGMYFKTFTLKELKALLERYGLAVEAVHGHNILASIVPDRWLLEKGGRSLIGRLALLLGGADLALSGTRPFSRFGFNFIVTCRKR